MVLFMAERVSLIPSLEVKIPVLVIERIVFCEMVMFCDALRIITSVLAPVELRKLFVAVPSIA